MKHSRLYAIRVMVGMLATLGVIGPAWSDTREAADGARLTELADGTLVGYRTNPAAVKQVRYAHQPSLVASDCLSLGTRRVAANGNMPALINGCSFPVAVSYCSDGSRTSAGACAAVGHRKMESHRIEPGAALRIENLASSAEEMYWVACRNSDAGVISTLTRNGTRGECLDDEQSPAFQTVLTESK